jgi:hypothetical protein
MRPVSFPSYHPRDLTELSTRQIANLATNDAGSLSLSEYAVAAIAPELAPNSFVENRSSRLEDDGDESTLNDVGGYIKEGRKGEQNCDVKRERRVSKWRRFMCL